jgi:hypothetical protein
LKKSGIGVIGVLAILMLVVLASGCTGTEKLLFQYNLSAGDSPNFVGVQNVTIPNGTSSVKFVAQNLTRLYPNVNTSNVIIYLLNTIPVSGATGENYTVNILEQKTIELANETQPFSVTYTFNNTQLKGLLIVNTNAKGLIQIFTT